MLPHKEKKCVLVNHNYEINKSKLCIYNYEIERKRVLFFILYLLLTISTSTTYYLNFLSHNYDLVPYKFDFISYHFDLVSWFFI